MARSVNQTYCASLRPEIAALETSGISQPFALGVEPEGVIPLRFGEGDLPGSAFGPGGEGQLRLCFAGGAERLSAALERLAPLFR